MDHRPLATAPDDRIVDEVPRASEPATASVRSGPAVAAVVDVNFARAATATGILLVLGLLGTFRPMFDLIGSLIEHW